jgi:hypothetical protein
VYLLSLVLNLFKKSEFKIVARLNFDDASSDEK